MGNIKKEYEIFGYGESISITYNEDTYYRLDTDEGVEWFDEDYVDPITGELEGILETEFEKYRKIENEKQTYLTILKSDISLNILKEVMELGMNITQRKVNGDLDINPNNELNDYINNKLSTLWKK